MIFFRHNAFAHLKDYSIGLPWWRSGWESACQCRGHGFEPWSGKIPYAAEQLGPWATITEPAHLEPVLCSKRGRDSEGPAHHDEEWPPLATTRESPHTETKTQHSHKKKKKRLQYIVNVTLMCTRQPKILCDLLYCDIYFIVLVWNQTLNISEVCL